MVHNPEKGELYIIGLLMGFFRGDVEWCSDTIYQAMPFAPALEHLQFLYDNRLKNLRPVVGESNGLPVDASLLSQHPQDSTTTGPTFSR